MCSNSRRAGQRQHAMQTCASGNGWPDTQGARPATRRRPENSTQTVNQGFETPGSRRVGGVRPPTLIISKLCRLKKRRRRKGGPCSLPDRVVTRRSAPQGVGGYHRCDRGRVRATDRIGLCTSDHTLWLGLVQLARSNHSSSEGRKPKPVLRCRNGAADRGPRFRLVVRLIASQSDQHGTA